MAEDVSLLDEVREASRRKGTCSVCEWLEGRDDADEWAEVLALPWQEANTKAIHRAMVKRGFEKGDKTVEAHRNRGHRVGG